MKVHTLVFKSWNTDCNFKSMLKLTIFFLILTFQTSSFAQTYEQEFTVQTNHQEALSGDFNLFVWNLYMLKYIDTQKLKDSAISELMNDADLLLLQEVIVEENDLHNKLGFDQFNVFQVPYLKKKRKAYRPNSIWNGFLTASKVISQDNRVFIGEAKDIADGTQSMAIVSCFPIEDSEKRLMIIHVHNGVSFFRTLNLLKRLKETVQAHQGPLIVAGDFNSFLYKKYLVKRWATKAKLHDSKVNTPFKFKFIKLGQLDHAFYRGLTLKQDVKVIKETKNFSDHQGYLLQFSLD